MLNTGLHQVGTHVVAGCSQADFVAMLAGWMRAVTVLPATDLERLAAVRVAKALVPAFSEGNLRILRGGIPVGALFQHVVDDIDRRLGEPVIAPLVEMTVVAEKGQHWV